MNEQELRKLNERLDTIELMLLALLDHNAKGWQMEVGNSLAKAQRLKQVLFSMGLK